MASFNIEFKKVILAEGGYTNDPDDAGEETLFGISRKYNPKAKFWKEIDSWKKHNSIKEIKGAIKNLPDNNDIIKEVKSIYKQEYWDCLHLDNIKSQDIAHHLFDTCVNMGFTTAVSLAQQVVGMTVTGIMNDELIYNIEHYGK